MVQFKTPWKNQYLIETWLCYDQVEEQGKKELLTEKRVSVCVIV